MSDVTRKRRHPEEDLHRAVVKFLSLALPPNAIFFHPANGGLRSRTEAQRFKAMGVIPGLVDLFVIDNGRVIGLELKAVKGRLSHVQAYCHCKLIAAGVPVWICRTLDDVSAALHEAGIPLRAQVAI